MSRPSPAAGLRLVFLLSGAPGLMAQLAWTRVFAASFGHELPSLVGVVSAFFAGLAAGAWALDRRLGSVARPVRSYAMLEAFSAGWIALGTALLPALDPLIRLGSGLETPAWARGLAAFLVPLLVAGPAAAAMGATLPAMDRAVAAVARGTRAVPGLYALNTAGAVAGVVAAVGWAMPALGFRGTLWIAAGLQAACAALALLALGRGVPAAEAEPAGVRPGDSPGNAPAHGDAEPGLAGLRLALLAGGTGFLGIGYELLGVRALAQATENTVQTFAAALAVFLAGTALGAGWVRGRLRRGNGSLIPTLLAGLSAVLVAEGAVLAWSPELSRSFGGPGRLGEGLLAVAMFFVPSALMGAVFAGVAQGARRPGGGVGRAVAWNALGGALGGPLVLTGLLPAWGLRGALAGLALGYLALAWWGTGRRPGFPWGGRLGPGVVAAGALALGLVPVRPSGLPDGAAEVWRREGFLATVSVVRGADGHRTLRVNHHFQQGGTATAAAARRHAHLPLLLHPSPHSALFLGVGTGITLGAASAHPGLRAEGVELLPEVVEALGWFEPENGGVRAREDVRVVVADARRFARVSAARYDVIIGDLFHPSEDGAGFLYTREHFAALRDRLAPGGVVCQWLPLHQLELESFRDVARTFREVFPDASLWLLRFNVDVPVVGLVSGVGALDPAVLQRRLEAPELSGALRPLALGEAVRVLGCRLADADSLGRMAVAGGVATDDRPRILFRGAGAAYDRSARPHRRLLALLGEAEPGWSRLLAGAAGERGAWQARLEAFRVGRDRHLHGLGLEADGLRREAAEAYLSSAEAGPDYTGGYAQAVLVASAYSRTDPGFARALLERLMRARPEQRLAAEVLERMRVP